jgi:thiamine-phosphate pyrophosphorylase
VTTLPRFIVVADLATVSARLDDVIASAVDHGARAVLLRARDATTAVRVELAAALRRRLDPVGGILIVAGGPGAAVHLAAGEPLPHPRPSTVGRSCHNAEEVDRALTEACDYAFVSPVFETASKPGYGPALGVEGLATLCRPGLPVYALGGVMPAHVAPCVGAGAHGVAVMGPVLRDPSIVAEYLAALKEVTG